MPQQPPCEIFNLPDHQGTPWLVLKTPGPTVRTGNCVQPSGIERAGDKRARVDVGLGRFARSAHCKRTVL